jgi:hypothetical protein
MCEQFPHIKIIAVDECWLNTNINAYKYREREKEIMNSEEFRKLISHRINHPECSKPEYNLIQHAKIDFLMYTIQNHLHQAEYYAWTDFGYFQNSSDIQYRPLKISQCIPDKMNMIGLTPVENTDRNIIAVLRAGTVRMCGNFYVAHKNVLMRYQELYHRILAEMYAYNIVDDDQHVMIRCFLEEPKLFHVWYLGGWFKAYGHFCREHL